MKRRSVLTMAIPALGMGTALPWAAGTASAGSSWLPLADQQLTTAKAGNALDFSSLGSSDAAGRWGWARAMPGEGIGFERQPAPKRFLCASMVFSPPNGGLPSKEEARQLVTELRRTGYNAVRLHYIDAALMQGRNKDFDVDPDGLARLHGLLAQLKEAGIYWLVDGMTSDNGGYGDVGPNRYVRKHDTKVDALLTSDGFDHWAQLVDVIWGVKNPHTGLAPLADPAMLGIILVNEGGLAFTATVRGNRYPPSLAAPFRAWLKRRYGQDSVARAAWSGEMAPAESLDGELGLPAAVRGQSPRDKDFARFISDTEVDGLRRMEAHVRSRGFGGLATAFDNWSFLGADLTRAQASWVDMHAYHSEPTRYVEPGSRVVQSGLLESVGRAVRELSNARQWGKPFTVSEYAQPFWHRSRFEMAALLPAFAAHQGWGLICQFAEVPVQISYGPSPFARRQAIYPFGVGADPIARAGERLAAVLFLRGDVAKSKHRIRLHLQPNALMTRSAGWEQVPEAVSRLAFVAPLGLDFGPLPEQPVPGELSLDLLGAAPPWLAKLQSALTKAGLGAGGEGVAQLRGAGIIDAANRSQPGRQRYESDTRQMMLDAREQWLTIDTPMTSVVVLCAGGSGKAGGFSVEQASGPALFAVSVLDGRALGESRRLLLWVLTDAMNTGMTFADEQRSTLTALGKFPPLVRTVAARLTIPNVQASDLKAWALSLNGERRESLPLLIDDRTVTLMLDTAALPGGPALFFELAVE